MGKDLILIMLAALLVMTLAAAIGDARAQREKRRRMAVYYRAKIDRLRDENSRLMARETTMQTMREERLLRQIDKLTAQAKSDRMLLRQKWSEARR